ncbi:signal peptidase I (plasmid) [Halorarum halophilum]|uniref:Signal peptidase I n=1 Tax=Halorarum halophilum TaxID=2743090 RepID=A0A7D5GKK8_9EURY|nr:signal peptidase I [Halobaculum halophilum]QLG29871.1 signal peptidase I [Halobaculum halophilum]
MLGRIALIIVVFAAVAVTTPASPVQVSYVYSDSMEPTIGQNDGYLVVPEGNIEQRDIIVFWSSERGEPVTHRVVGRSSAGLLTQGDNNDITDQAAGYSYVQREEIVGTVFTIHGEPVTIPGLGILVSLMGTHRLVVLGAAGLLIAGSMLYNSGTHHSRPGRAVVRVNDVMHPLFAVALLTGIVFLLIGANGHELTYVAVDGTVGGPNTLTVGEATNETVLITAPSIPFTHRMVSTDGMTITSQSENASTVTAQVYIPGPTERGAYTTSIRVCRYPAVLPEQTVRTLHAVHPTLAACITMGLLFAPFFVLYVLVLDGQQPLRTSRSRWRSRLGGRNQ